MNFYYSKIPVNKLIYSIDTINYEYLLRVYKGIKEKGLKRPLIVRELKKNNKFKILVGNLRCLSLIKLKCINIPCVIITEYDHKNIYKIKSHDKLLKICKVKIFNYDKNNDILTVNGPGLGYQNK